MKLLMFFNAAARWYARAAHHVAYCRLAVFSKCWGCELVAIDNIWCMVSAILTGRFAYYQYITAAGRLIETLGPSMGGRHAGPCPGSTNIIGFWRFFSCGLMTLCLLLSAWAARHVMEQPFSISAAPMDDVFIAQCWPDGHYTTTGDAVRPADIL